MQSNVKKRPWVNALAVVIIAAVAACGFFVSQALGEKPQGAVAVVHDGDGGTTQIALDGTADGEHVISTSHGVNTLVVEEGRVWVSDADCPNHDCVEQGAIDETNEQIVCLPHKLWIEVTGDKAAHSGDSYDTVGR